MGLECHTLEDEDLGEAELLYFPKNLKVVH
jgi:hypothetical protein